MNRLSEIELNNRPTVVSFGGSKGGVGRSTLCAEVARSLARHGNRICCVDANWEVPTINNLLHAEELRHGPNWTPLDHPDGHVADFITETAIRNVFLVSLASARRRPFTPVRLDAWTIMMQLMELDFDFIFLDLPPNNDPFSISLQLLADLPIIVISPEPAAVRCAIQTARTALLHSLGLHELAEDVHDDLVELSLNQNLTLNREEILQTAASAEVRRIITDNCDRLEMYLVANFVREGAERDFGFVVCHAIAQELGVYPRYLGSVDYEDRRWFFNRRVSGQPARGEEALSEDIESVARSIRDIHTFDAEYPRPVPRDPTAHPARGIGLRADLGRNELRQHCRKLWEGYRREASIGLVLSPSSKRLEIADRLEATYRKILTLSGENPNIPTNVEPEPPAPRPKKVTPAPTADTPAKNAIPAGREITRIRKQHNMSLHDLSLRSHIGVKYLSAIEAGDPDHLPRPVYLRGYLREIARVFEIDPEDFIEQYFRFLGHP